LIFGKHNALLTERHNMLDPSNDAKKTEVLRFLHERVFDPILDSPSASNSLKSGIRQTVMRLNERDARGIVQFYWSAIIGTERSSTFAKKMREEGFTRFEEIIEEFRNRFNDKWLGN
jgi:predicted glycosyl hydrolase (DUF1957 family)